MQLNCPNWITSAPGSLCQVGRQIVGCSRWGGGQQAPGPICSLPVRRRREEEEMVLAQHIPQSHASCPWHLWHALTSGTFSSKIPHNLSSRSKEDITPWLAPGPESTPAIKNLCASGSSQGSLPPGTDRHTAANRAGLDLALITPRHHGDRRVTQNSPSRTMQGGFRGERSKSACGM